MRILFENLKHTGFLDEVSSDINSLRYLSNYNDQHVKSLVNDNLRTKEVDRDVGHLKVLFGKNFLNGIITG